MSICVSINKIQYFLKEDNTIQTLNNIASTMSRIKSKFILRKKAKKKSDNSQENSHKNKMRDNTDVRISRYIIKT